MRLLKQQLKSKFKPFMAMFLVFLTAFGAMPLNVLASEGALNEPDLIIEAEPFIARIDGEDVLVSADGIAFVQVEGFNEPVAMEVPRYIYLDGERIPIDDDSIENIAPVVTSISPLSVNPMAAAEAMPSVGFIVSISGALPNNPNVVQIGPEFTHPAYVTMNGQIVSSRRYVVIINGVSYEAFCADPNLPGPETNAAVYELTSADGSQFRTVLRYGFPINPALTAGDDDERTWNAYITRIAVAYISRPNATWGRLEGSTLSAVNNRINGVGGATAMANSPAITVNGMIDREEDGDISQSEPFVLGHSRRTNCHRNPFRFEWDQSTPAGARLYVDGSLVATAPTNPTDIFTVNPGGGFTTASEFHFIMPQGSEGQTARVSLVGINNQYADRVFVMQNPNDIDGWQDIIFYVPEVLAHAAYTWDTDPNEVFGRLRITKLSAENGSTLAGAVFHISGPNGFNETRTTPANGVIELTNLSPGVYSITEQSPPPNYKLSEPTTQTVTITEGSDAWVTVNFANPRNGNGGGNGNGYESSTSVFIEKVDALSRENIPNATHSGSGALIRLQGMSSMTIVAGDGQSVVFNNTGVNLSQILTANAQIAPPGIPGVTSTVGDGWWRLEGLPYGFYSVVEERAPDGFSLLPQHTAYSFWLHPPDVTIGLNVVETQVVIPWDDVLAMLEELAGANTPAEDLQAVLDIMTAALGAVELVVIPVFEIEQNPHVNAVHKIFENYPFSEIVVYKRAINNGIEGDFLPGATFRIEGFFVEGNAPQIIDMVGTTDESGRLVFRGLPAGNYTITELQAPAGFLRNYPYHRSVNVSWGQIDGHPTRPAPSIVFFNTPKSSLEIHKVCATTGANLSGAVFEISDPTSGETWQATTNASGRAIFGQGSLGNFLYPGHTYLVREVVAPQGFILNNTPREIVLSPGDNNVITWTNYHNPSLTIIKRDAADHRLLAGAVFEVAFENGQTIAGSPFTTDSQGRIVIPEILGDNETERTLIVTEISPPPGYNLANPNWQRVVMRAGEDNVITFDNERMPTLTIQKIDARTGYPIQGAWFEIEYLGATAGTGSGNIGPSGPLTGNPFITDSNGRIVIENVYSGRFLIREIRAANNYWLDPLEQNRTWIIEVRDNEDYVLTIENTLLPTLVITKRNAVTWRPIPMTQFRVEYEVPNSPSVVHVGTFMTNAQGQIILPFVGVGWYRVTETRPAPGMTLATNNSFRVFLQPGDNSYTLIREGVIASESMIVPTGNPTPSHTGDEPAIEGDEGTAEQLPPSDGNNSNQGIPNAPTPDIPSGVAIDPIDPDTDAIVDQGLAPEQSNPTNGPYLPDTPDFDEDWLDNVDLENLPIYHYDNPNLPSEANGRLNVWGGEMFWDNALDIWNFPQNTLVIRKENAVTGELLAGARFSVTRVSSGDDSGLHGTVIGEWTTNHSGILVIAGLDPGFYVIEETQSPPNFTLSANTRQHVFMRPDDTSVVSVTFSNMPFSGLLITLRCSVTSAPIQNGEFRVTTSDGAVVGTDNGIFWTNLQGEILIPNVRPDSYVITQVTVPDTHVINLTQSTQTIRVNPTGQIYRVDFFSDPLSQLLITLRCEVSGQPIQGGEFQVTNSAGNVVGSSNGIFFTNQQGEITIPNLGTDSYVVTQLNAADGWRLGDQNSQTIFISRPSETYSLNFTNEPYSGLIIQNLDGYNGDPLPGVRFRIDRINESGNVLIGEHVTDHEGRIELIGLLGSFTISQIDVPNGWEHDPQPTRIVHVNTGAPTLVTFVSPRMGSLEITLSDEDGNPLVGGRFEVRHQNGQLVGEFVTPVSGMISIPNLGSGWFTVEQVAPSPGFVMTDTGRSVEVATNTVTRANFVNIQRPALVIEKVDTDGNPLQGAEFEMRTLAGALIHRATTNNGGVITIAQLDPMAVVLTETRAPEGFVITEPSRTVEITAGQTLVERFVNHRAPALIIEKVDEQGHPLAGAEFEIRRLNGELVHRIVTNNGGTAVIDVLEPGAYQILETRAPDGFAIVEPNRAIQIVAGQTLTERFVNPRLATFIIHKIDGVTGESLQGVVFEITTLAGERIRNPQNNSFEFVTDNAGMIRLPQLEAGSYVAVEIRPLPGFMAADPMPFVVGHDRDYIITVRNFRYPDYTIRKLDGHTGEPLADVQFEVARFFADGRTGERLRNPADGSFIWTTDRAGLIRIPNLEHGTFVATELRPLPGYILADPVVFVVDDHQPTTITIHNYRYSEWNIRKLDGDTNRPLEGVVFEVSHFFGTGTTGDRLRNPLDGSFEFVTDAAGIVRLGALEPGTFLITETRALPGFIPAEPVVITVEANAVDTTVTIRNYRAPNLTIRKINSVTRQPIQGVVFNIASISGERVTNPQTGFFDFVTDSNGLIHLPEMNDGTFLVTEVRAAEGFFGLDDAVVLHINSQTRQQNYLIVVENTPASGLLIIKTDANTRAPLQGVEFEVRHADGGLVRGLMADQNQPSTQANSPNIAPNGNFLTDHRGMIHLNHLEAGVFHVTEVQALPGFLLDNTVHVVTITPGRLTTLEVVNEQMAGLRLLKIDSVTRQGIQGVEFRIFDVRQEATYSSI